MYFLMRIPLGYGKWFKLNNYLSKLYYESNLHLITDKLRGIDKVSEKVWDTMTLLFVYSIPIWHRKISNLLNIKT